MRCWLEVVVLKVGGAINGDGPDGFFVSGDLFIQITIAGVGSFLLDELLEVVVVVGYEVFD